MPDPSPLRTPAPDWFRKAIDFEPESRFAAVNGTQVHYLSWNAQDVDKPGLLLAHGFRAHARWWSFIAPFFLSRFRVVALDFSGMGDSGSRATYDGGIFSRDIAGVIRHARLRKTTVVGHSFGGGCMLRFCADEPQQVERAIIVDSNIPIPGFECKEPQVLEQRPNRVYPTLAAARERFRLVPEHNCAAPYVLDYVARHSIKEVEGGWTWKFDAKCWPQLAVDIAQAAAALVTNPVPLTFIYGDLSMTVSPKLAQAIVDYLPQARGPIAIPQAHHHVLLDQPLSLVSALRGILY